MTTVATLANKSLRRKSSYKLYDFVLPDTLMGVEVEVDRDNGAPSIMPVGVLSYWDQQHDGSLVNGYEYTLRMPMAGAMLSEAVSQLFAPPSEFYRTFTGSTHIHMDMLEEEVTLDVLRTTVLLVFALEPMLYASGDATREWCGYANSLKSAEPLLLATLFSSDVENRFRRVYSRGGQLGRYYGLNLAALTDYGSLEFRYFPTASSPEELVKWINLVQCFKKAALEIGTPEKLRNVIGDELSFNDMMVQYFSSYRDLFPALGGWQKVNSMYTKAIIVSQDDCLPTASGFVAKDVFSEGKFSSLVSVEELGELSEMAAFTNNGTVPRSTVEDGHVLMHGGRLYVRIGGDWYMVGEPCYSSGPLPGPTIARLAWCLTNQLIMGRLSARDVYHLEFAAREGRLLTHSDPHIFEPSDDDYEF